MERLELLMAGYLDGVLSPDDRPELAERLRADREAAQSFAAFYQQDRLLRELHRATTDEGVEPIMADIAHTERSFVGNVMQAREHHGRNLYHRSGKQ